MCNLQGGFMDACSFKVNTTLEVDYDEVNVANVNSNQIL